MRILKVTSGGQVSIPADVRRRWQTHRAIAEDEGDRLILRPAPDDPIAALKGIWKDLSLPSTEDLRRLAREGERRSEERKWRRSLTPTR